MVDYSIDIRKQLYPNDEIPDEMKQRRIHVLSQLQELQEEVEPILQLMRDDEVMKNMENMRDSKTLINFLSKEYGVSLTIFLKVLNLININTVVLKEEFKKRSMWYYINGGKYTCISVQVSNQMLTIEFIKKLWNVRP